MNRSTHVQEQTRMSELTSSAYLLWLCHKSRTVYMGSTVTEQYATLIIPKSMKRAVRGFIIFIWDWLGRQSLILSKQGSRLYTVAVQLAVLG